MCGPAVTDAPQRQATKVPRGQRVRINVSYTTGGGSDLEEAFRLAGLTPDDSGAIAHIFALGALVWAQGGGVARTREGLRVVFPGDAGALSVPATLRPEGQPPATDAVRCVREAGGCASRPAGAEPNKMPAAKISPTAPASAVSRVPAPPSDSPFNEVVPAGGAGDVDDSHGADFDPLLVDITELAQPPLDLVLPRLM